jgi:hypothetical protein
MRTAIRLPMGTKTTGRIPARPAAGTRGPGRPARPRFWDSLRRALAGVAW